LFLTLNVLIVLFSSSTFAVFAFTDNADTKTLVSGVGSAVSGSLSLLTAGFFLIYGSLLVRSLTSDFKSKHATKLFYVANAFSFCLILNSALTFVSQFLPEVFQANFDLLNGLFYTLDIVSLGLVMFLFAKAVREAEAAANKRKYATRSGTKRGTRNSSRRSQTAVHASDVSVRGLSRSAPRPATDRSKAGRDMTTVLESLKEKRLQIEYERAAEKKSKKSKLMSLPALRITRVLDNLRASRQNGEQKKRKRGDPNYSVAPVNDGPTNHIRMVLASLRAQREIKAAKTPKKKTKNKSAPTESIESDDTFKPSRKSRKSSLTVIPGGTWEEEIELDASGGRHRSSDCDTTSQGIDHVSGEPEQSSNSRGDICLITPPARPIPRSHSTNTRWAVGSGSPRETSPLTLRIAAPVHKKTPRKASSNKKSSRKKSAVRNTSIHQRKMSSRRKKSLKQTKSFARSSAQSSSPLALSSLQPRNSEGSVSLKARVSSPLAIEPPQAKFKASPRADVLPSAGSPETTSHLWLAQ
jgi:hypothetical protein